MQTLAMPKAAEPWSLTSLREKLIKIGSRVVGHGRYVTFQLAEVTVPRQMFREILSLIVDCGCRLHQHDGGCGQMRQTTAQVRLDEGEAARSSAARRPAIVSAGQRTPRLENLLVSAANCRGRSRVQLANLTNIAPYVAARIVPAHYQGEYLGNSDLQAWAVGRPLADDNLAGVKRNERSDGQIS
jgi:hypothetical protein